MLAPFLSAINSMPFLKAQSCFRRTAKKLGEYAEHNPDKLGKIAQLLTAGALSGRQVTYLRLLFPHPDCGADHL